MSENIKKYSKYSLGDPTKPEVKETTDMLVVSSYGSIVTIDLNQDSLKEVLKKKDPTIKNVLDCEKVKIH